MSATESSSERLVTSRSEAESRMIRAGWSSWEIEEELAETFGGRGHDGRRIMGSLEIVSENSRLYEAEGRFREPTYRV